MIRWFRQYLTVSKNSFVVSLGDPFFTTLILFLLTAMALFACVPSFTFGDHLRLVRDQSLALTFICGCIACVLGASRVFVEDIRRGATSILMTRPLGHACYIAGKWTGLVSSIFLVHTIASLAVLWVTRFSNNQHETLDITTILIYFSSLLFAIGLIGVKHYLFGGCYVWQVNVAMLISFSLAFILANFIDDSGNIQAFGVGIDWGTSSGSLMLAFALFLYLSTIIPLAIIFDTSALIVSGVLLFFFSIISAYLIESASLSHFFNILANSILPNLQLFWISDRLSEGIIIPYQLFFHAMVHSIFLSIIPISIAIIIFSKREITS